MKPRVKINGRSSYKDWEPLDTGVVDGYCKEDNDLFARTYTLQTTCLNHSSVLIKALLEEEKIKSQIRKETISIIGDIIRAIK